MLFFPLPVKKAYPKKYNFEFKDVKEKLNLVLNTKFQLNFTCLECFVKKVACFLHKKDFILCFDVKNQSKFLFRKKRRNRRQQKKISRRLSSKLLKNLKK